MIIDPIGLLRNRPIKFLRRNEAGKRYPGTVSVEGKGLLPNYCQLIKALTRYWQCHRNDIHQKRIRNLICYIQTSLYRPTDVAYRRYVKSTG